MNGVWCVFSLFSLEIFFTRFFLQICVFREASHAAFCSLFSFAGFHLMLRSFLLHKLKWSLHADSPIVFLGESAVFSAAAAESSDEELFSAAFSAG